jgi:uncharacterized protein (TIGR02246 family)
VAFLCIVSTSVLAADDQAIKDRIQSFQDAWNKHDVKAMAGVFTDDGTLVNPFAVTAHGRDEISKVFTDEHEHAFKATTYTSSDIAIQSITSDVAVVDSTGNITGIQAPDGSATADFPHHVTWVFVKQDGKWMVAAARAFQFSGKPGEEKQ